MKLPALSTSMRSLYKSCPRKVFFRYVAGVEPKTIKSPALFMGRAFHMGLEQWRKVGNIPDAVRQGQACLLDGLQANGFEDAVIDAETAKLNAYLNGYTHRFGADRKRVWAPEVKVENQDEVAYFDAVFEDDGHVWVVEDKTRGRFAENLEWVLRVDDQLLSYACMAVDSGMHFGGFVYRETKKTTSRVTKKETVSQFAERMMTKYINEMDDLYRECVISYSPQEIDRYRSEKYNLNIAIQSAFKIHSFENWPRNTANCAGPYGECPFLALCATGSDALGQRYQSNDKEPLDGGRFKSEIW